MRFNDLTLGALFAAFGAFIVYSAIDLPTARHIRFGPGLMPTLVGSGMVICGAILAIRDLVTEGRPRFSMTFPEWMSDASRQRKMFLLFTAMVAFAPLVVWIGFQLATLMFLSVLFASGGMAWARAIPASLLATTLVHLVFVEALNVPLPWGVLTELQPFLSPF